MQWRFIVVIWWFFWWLVVDGLSDMVVDVLVCCSGQQYGVTNGGGVINHGELMVHNGQDESIFNGDGNIHRHFPIAIGCCYQSLVIVIFVVGARYPSS